MFLSKFYMIAFIKYIIQLTDWNRGIFSAVLSSFNCQGRGEGNTVDRVIIPTPRMSKNSQDANQ